jgi:hypothetical protein
MHRSRSLGSWAAWAFAGAAAAQPEVYFSEYKFQDARFSAMGADGAAPSLLFEPPIAQWLPLGVVYRPDTQRMIWIDSAGSSDVVSADLDGSGLANLAAPPGFCRGASLDAQGRIFFSSNNRVMRVNADGGGLVTLFTGQSGDPLGNPRVDAANGHLYVGADGEIKRMNLDGSAVKTVVRGVLQPRSIGLDIGRGFIYWIDADIPSDFVGRARLDDSDFTVLIDNSPSKTDGSSGLIELLVDPVNGNLYYADELTGAIARAGLNGQFPHEIYSSPPGFAPSGLTLSTGEPAQAIQDCNGNGIGDDADIAQGAPDCDDNGVIDTCQEDPCPERFFLLDQGSDAADSVARAVGVPSQWQVFQPFDVPGGGWAIGEVGLDGYTSNYADGSGLTVRLFPDDGTGQRPDESQQAGAVALNLRFNFNNENWVYAALPAVLGEGRWWARIEANNPTVYGAGINHGLFGLPSLSRGQNGNFTDPAPPVALRLIRADACYADFVPDGSLDLFDFLSYVNAFNAAEGSADCNGDEGLDLFDFLCFVNAFNAGC